MLPLWSFRWLVLHVLFAQFHLQFGESTWPKSNTSIIQLLGLFHDKFNETPWETTTIFTHSRAMFIAAVLLSQQLNITIDGHPIGWQTAPTDGGQFGAVDSTCRSMSIANIIGIVGPSFSRETPVIVGLTKAIGIPVISYAATNPALSNKKVYSTFYRTVPSDYSAILALVKLFIKYKWNSYIIIFQNDDFGVNGADTINNVFYKNNLTASGTLLFDIDTVSFRQDLKNTLLTSTSRIVIVWADSIYLPSIIQYGLDNDVIGPHFLWILSTSVSLNTFNQSYYSKLVGMLTIEPAVGNQVGASINTTLLDTAYTIWQKYEPATFPGSTNVESYALFAFDAAWSLIQSLQRLCTLSNINNSSSCLSFINSTFCFAHRFLNTDTFFNIITTTNFLGVSGLVQFSNNTTDRINDIYYIVRNAQPSGNALSYVSVLQWSVETNDWKSPIGSNVIIWPGSTLTSPTGLPSLSGVTLRIGIVGPPPFVMTKNITDQFGNTTKTCVGYIPNLLDILQARLGFIPQITVLSGLDSYDSYVKTVADNVYDMLIGDVTITADRREYVDFSSSIFDNALRVIIRQDSPINYPLLSFMKPFSVRLWLVILGALLYAAALLCLLERHENEVLRERSLVSSIAMTVWFSFGTLVGYGADFHVHTAAGRLITLGLYILSIILVATYTANLTSDLTILKSQHSISGIDDIKNGKVPYSRVGILVNSAIEDYYLREISDGSRNFYPLESMYEMYACLLNDTIDVSMMDIGSVEYATNTIYCNLTLVGAGFDASAFGIVIQKQWLYTQALDVNILALRESGTIDNLRKNWFDKQTCADSSTHGSTSTSPQAILGLFLTFAIIGLLSIMLFIWLKRYTIIAFLWKVIQRKTPSDKEDSSLRTISTSNSYASSSRSELDSVSLSTIRL